MTSGKQVYFQALEWSECKKETARAPSRSILTRKPDWSFAGNLKDKSNDIMTLVSYTVETGIGTKDDLPLIYVSNPPRHGKSLLLDSLFSDDSSVCVLNATFNGGTSHREEEWYSPEGAVCGLLVRLLHDLVTSHPTSWTNSWDKCPLTKLLPKAMAEHNPSCLVRCFEEMLQVHDKTLVAPAKLLICIDEISVLTDHPSNTWFANQDRELQKRFWRSIFALTRADSNWIRVVMTGFTDNPVTAVAASDISCRPMSLSLISDPEQEVLVAELLWVHAFKNVRFPGLLWTLVKSTPGLLGLWAQQINLNPLLSSATPNLAMDFHEFQLHTAASIVPWVGTLMSNCIHNWTLIRQFLVEDGAQPATAKIARNAGIATDLAGKTALSPFAVAITVLAMRSLPSYVVDDQVFLLFNEALKACEQHSAGCAAGCSCPWPITIQRALQNFPKKTMSRILTEDSNLQPTSADLVICGRLDVFPGAIVNNIGEPFEAFVLSALALRLQCLVLNRTKERPFIIASQFLPEGVGVLRRPAGHGSCRTRDAVETEVVLAVCTDPAVDLPKLCTQTAALLLPSTISSMLQAPSPDDSISLPKHCCDHADHDTVLSVMGKLLFNFERVLVLKDTVPRFFPVVLVSPRDGAEIHHQLVDALSVDLNSFNPHDFVTKHVACNVKEVASACADVKSVVEIVTRAVTDRTAILFRPSDTCNPLCDVVMVLPTVLPTAISESASTRHVSFVFIELRDRVQSNFGEKLDKFTTKFELLLTPVKCALGLTGIAIERTIFVCCGRCEVQVQTAGFKDEGDEG